MISQKWFREWFGAIKQQAIAWAIVDQGPWPHVPFVWANELTRLTPSAAYMRQWIGSALVQIMACRLFGAKPLSKPMLCYCLLEPKKEKVKLSVLDDVSIATPELYLLPTTTANPAARFPGAEPSPSSSVTFCGKSVWSHKPWKRWQCMSVDHTLINGNEHW